MTLKDKRLMILLTGLFILTSITGGMDHWMTPNNFLIHMTVIYLPCIAVWFGRRLENPVHAIGFPVVLGLILMLPTLLFFTKRFRMDDVVMLIFMTVFLPGIIAAGSRAVKRFLVVRLDNTDKEALRASAKKTRLLSILCFVVFPQFMQPALLDMALTLENQGKTLDNDAEIIAPAKTAQKMTMVSLGIFATIFILSLLMAMTDTFL
tara:strand:- start:2134 stop:2754 length:621 start_codon:yes stop_codon:yes gene_type:complete